MKNLLLLLIGCIGLSACASPAVVLIPAVIGAGLANNNENLEEPLTEPKEIANAIKDGIVAGYSQEGNTTLELNK